MSTPLIHEPADETKVYAGPPAHADGHAIPNRDAANHDGGNGGGHDGPQMDIKPMPTGVVVLLVAAFVVLLGGLFALGFVPRHRSGEAADKEVAQQTQSKPVVGVTTAKPPSQLPTLEVPGDAQAYQLTSIYPRASGYLKKRLVDIGDKVKEGQLLAEIDAPEVEAQRAAAEANLQQARAAATKAKDDYDLTEATFTRYESFAKTGGVTQQQLDEKRSALTSAKATLAGAQASVKADEAEVQRLTALVGFTQITAPFAGTITTRGYDVGALLSANNGGGRELFELAQVDVLRVFVDIPQSYASAVKPGQPVKFVVTTFPTKPFEGYIARTSGAINQATRTMRVEADFPNKEGLLFPGMYGTLRYEIREKMNQLVIPSSALVFGPEGLRVGVVDAENKVRFKPVKLGVDLGTEVEIVQGLEGSERIVANPGERLTDGIEVQIAEAKTNTGGAAPAGTDNKGGTRTAEASAR